MTAKNHDLMQLNRENGQWLERQTRLERELAQARQRADAQQRERDAPAAAAEHQALQVRWTQDVHALEGVRTDCRRRGPNWSKSASAGNTPRRTPCGPRCAWSTLEQLLAQLRLALRWRTKRHRSRCNAGRRK
ncbi:integrase [Xanthomonas citri]|uniref:integrase n=1 Tax=Xanthomonas citri TaxID=346 RepID=UPI003FA28E0E